MLENFRQLLAVVALYWSQLAILGTVTVAGIKVVTDRLNKRDELRYGELLKIRNAEVRNYSQALGEALSKLNMVTVVLTNNKEDIRKFRDEFLQVYGSLVKAFMTLHFFIPAGDEKSLEAFQNNIINVINSATVLLSRYINNRIQTDQEFEAELTKFTKTMVEVGDMMDEVTPAVQRMIRSYNRIERPWYKFW